MLFLFVFKVYLAEGSIGAMLGLSRKTSGFQLNHIPKRSTLSDVNRRRDALVFENIFHGLLEQYGEYLRDNENTVKKQIYCVLIVNLLLTVIKKRLKRHWGVLEIVDKKLRDYRKTISELEDKLDFFNVQT